MILITRARLAVSILTVIPDTQIDRHILVSKIEF